MILLREVRQGELPERWPAIEPEISAILEWSKPAYTAAWVLNGIQEGRLMLLEVMRKAAGIGFVVAQVDTHSEVRTLYLFGVAVPAESGWHAGTAKALEALARRLGCRQIKAKSPRRGWERIGAALGFEPLATEHGKVVTT